MDTLNKFEKPSKSIKNESGHMFYKSFSKCPNLYFFEKSMIAHAALDKKDTPRFASIQAILDSVEFLENYDVIMTKFSSSCCYIYKKDTRLPHNGQLQP